MLRIIQSLTDPLCRLVQDDPVRPEIPLDFRVSAFSEIFVLCDDLTHEPTAAVCCAYKDLVPRDVIELAQPSLEGSVAVFYTIWSYQAGAGRKLIIAARRWIESNRQPRVKEFVTLSPPTEMARVFHLRNGAEIFRVNPDSVNYVYP